MKRTIALSIALLLISASTYAGGGWVQKKGEGFYKLSEWWIVFDQHYTDVGFLDPNLTTGIFNTNLYVEQGLGDRWTGLLNATIFSRNYMNNLKSEVTNNVLIEGEAVNSIGDIDLGAKYGITEAGSKVAIAGSLIFGIPTGKKVAGEQENLQTGDGEFNQMLRLDAGTSLLTNENMSIYSNVYAAMNNRANDFSDELRFGLEAGFGFMDSRLWLATKLDVVEIHEEWQCTARRSDQHLRQ